VEEAKGKTLWEMWKDWWHGKKPETSAEQYFNPIKAKLGSSITVDEIDLNKLTFLVKEIEEYQLTYGKKQFKFTDYTIKAVPIDGEPVTAKLRVYPAENLGAVHQVVLLRLHDEIKYDPEFLPLLENNDFSLTNDQGQIEATFYRINDVTTPYNAQVSDLSEMGLEKTTRKYWDYWRETDDEAGQPTKEFFFVEEDGDSHQIRMWRGQEVHPSRVSVI